MRVAVAGLLALSLLGCDGPPGVPDRDAAGAMPRVELGTGTSRFEPLPETGAELELVGGPQGGFHVFVTARIHDLDVESLLIRYDAVDPATGTPVGHDASFVVDPTRLAREGDGWVRAGDFVILHDSSPDPVRGLTLEVRVHVEEQAGDRSADDSRVVRIIDLVSG